MESYSCDACGGSFKSKQEIDDHMKTEHAAQPSEKTVAGQQQKAR